MYVSHPNHNNKTEECQFFFIEPRRDRECTLYVCMCICVYVYECIYVCEIAACEMETDSVRRARRPRHSGGPRAAKHRAEPRTVGRKAAGAAGVAERVRVRERDAVPWGAVQPGRPEGRKKTERRA